MMWGRLWRGDRGDSHQATIGCFKCSAVCFFKGILNNLAPYWNLSSIPIHIHWVVIMCPSQWYVLSRRRGRRNKFLSNVQCSDIRSHPRIHPLIIECVVYPHMHRWTGPHGNLLGWGRGNKWNTAGTERRPGPLAENDLGWEQIAR